MKTILTFILFAYTTIFYCQDSIDFQAQNNQSFWQLKFEDNGTENWKKHWFLDGNQASVENSENGINFSAGPTEGDDASHAMLWTNKVFKGDIKIEYNYTRTDTQTSWVNILYIQATGVKPFKSDISKWNELRTIPSMKTYFENMKALHISYAAFDNQNKEYIRVRKYPVLSGKNFNTTTEITPASFNTGLFKPFETYKITVIKTVNKLYFHVQGKNDNKLFSWDISNIEHIKKGRIGLRHMYTRSSRYADFKVYTK
jgi:hypothetical protein